MFTCQYSKVFIRFQAFYNNFFLQSKFWCLYTWLAIIGYFPLNRDSAIAFALRWISSVIALFSLVEGVSFSRFSTLFGVLASQVYKHLNFGRYGLIRTSPIFIIFNGVYMAWGKGAWSSGQMGIWKWQTCIWWSAGGFWTSTRFEYEEDCFRVCGMIEGRV